MTTQTIVASILIILAIALAIINIRINRGGK